jgi:ribosome-binding factor A
MSTARASRIAAQLQRSLAELLRRGVKDPRVGNVTVTAVSLAPDLSVARILFLPFGSAHSGEEVLSGLRSAAGFLRGELARDLKLRHAPRLEFQLDTDLERAQKLTQLIDRAVSSDRSRSAAAAEPQASDEEP